MSLPEFTQYFLSFYSGSLTVAVSFLGFMIYSDRQKKHSNLKSHSSQNPKGTINYIYINFIKLQVQPRNRVANSSLEDCLSYQPISKPKFNQTVSIPKKIDNSSSSYLSNNSSSTLPKKNNIDQKALKPNNSNQRLIIFFIGFIAVLFAIFLGYSFSVEHGDTKFEAKPTSQKYH